MLRFLSGIAVGYGIGLLLAPAAGGETRKKLSEEASHLIHAPERKLNQALDAVPEKAAELASDAARKSAQEAIDKVREKTGLRPTGSYS